MEDFYLMTWNIDAPHSRVGFAVKHMMVSTVKGHFTVFSGTLNVDEANPANSWVEAEIDARSIDTRDAGRDGHLRTAGFLDIEKFPKITFKSTSVNLRMKNIVVGQAVDIHVDGYN